MPSVDHKIELKGIQPEDLIEANWLNTYQSERDELGNQLFKLNTNLFILQKIAGFRFDLFGWTVGTPVFWKFTFDSLFEASLSILWKISIDTDGTSLNIPSFKNRVIQNIVRYEPKKQLCKELKAIRFDRSLSEIKDRVEVLRHKYVAHFDRKWNTERNHVEIKKWAVQVSELLMLTERLTGIFDLLCFGHTISPLPIDYLSDVFVGGKPQDSTDIEKLLELWAKESAIFNLPENDPQVWKIVRENENPEDLELLNKLRLKFGLPPA